MVPYKRWLAPSRRMMKEISSSSFLFLFIFRSQYFHHYLCSWTNHCSLLGMKWCILGDPGAVSEAREGWNGRKNRRSLTLFLRPFRPSLAPPSAPGYPRMEMMDIWWKNGNLRVKRSLRRTPTSWNINSCKEQDLQISFAVLLLWRNHESYPANHVRETRVYTYTTVKSIVKNVHIWMYIKLSG